MDGFIMDGGMFVMDGGMSGLASIMIVAMIGIFAVGIVLGIRQWSKNNNSPVLTVEALVVAKRADVSHYHHDLGESGMSHASSTTDYYVTFEVDSGSRMEFSVRDREYGILAEGDRGKLTFQGTRYQGFVRDLG